MSPGIGVGVGLPFVHLQRRRSTLGRLIPSALGSWWVANRNTSGDLTDGSGGGRTLTDSGATLLPHDGTDYVRFPGTTGNNLSVAGLAATTAYDYTAFYVDGTTATGEETTDGSGNLVLGNTQTNFDAKDVVRILVVVDGTTTIVEDIRADDAARSTGSFVAMEGNTVTINRSATGAKLEVVDRPYAVLDGVDDYFYSADSFFNVAADEDFTAGIVLRYHGSPGTTVMLGKRNAAGFGAGWSLYFSSGSSQAEVGDGSDEAADANLISASTIQTFSTRLDRSVNQLESLANGTASGSPGDATAVGALTNANQFRIGAAGGGSAYGHFLLVGAYFVKAALTDEEEAAVTAALIAENGAPATVVADWYVDSENGNDGNDGNAIGQEFATIAAALSAMSSGQTVSLARGSTFREPLTTTAPISVRAHGEGHRPKILGSEVQANASFSQVSTSDAYSISYTPTDDTVRVWEDGVWLTPVASSAACQSTAGSSYYDAAADTLYVHATDSSDVSANGKVYEASSRVVAIDNAQDGCLFEDLDVRYVGGSGDMVTDGSGATTYRRIYARGASDHAFLLTSATGVVVENAELVDSKSSALVFFQATNCTFRNSTVRATSGGPADFGNAVFAHGSGTAGNTVSNVTAICAAETTAGGAAAAFYAASDCDSLTVEKSFATGPWDHGWLDAGTNNTLRTSGLAIAGNDLTAIQITGTGALLSFVTFYGDDTYMLSVGDGASATMRNCIVYHGASDFYISIHANATWVADHNFYYGSARGSAFGYGGFVSFAAYQSASGQDANSSTSDPTLSSVGGSTPEDYQLSGGSPAIAAGTAISGIVADYFGNTYADPPSVGFHEAA